MPTIVDWTTLTSFRGSRFTLGLQVNEAAAGGFYTGARTFANAGADRLTCLVTVPPTADRDVAGEREGYLFSLRSQRLWMRFGFPHRPIPRGTLRGTPTVTNNVAAGALTIDITTTASVTLNPGDFLGCGSNSIIMVGIPGDTASGGGAMAGCPLAFPCPIALTAGASLTWDRPQALWQFDGDHVQIEYSPAVIQEGFVIPFRQVINTA